MRQCAKLLKICMEFFQVKQIFLQSPQVIISLNTSLLENDKLKEHDNPCLQFTDIIVANNNLTLMKRMKIFYLTTVDI